MCFSKFYVLHKKIANVDSCTVNKIMSSLDIFLFVPEQIFALGKLLILTYAFYPGKAKMPDFRCLLVKLTFTFFFFWEKCFLSTTTAV